MKTTCAIHFSLHHKWKNICLSADYTCLQSGKNTFPWVSSFKNIKYHTRRYFLKDFKKLEIFFIWLTLILTMNKPYISRSKSKVFNSPIVLPFGVAFWMSVTWPRQLIRAQKPRMYGWSLWRSTKVWSKIEVCWCWHFYKNQKPWTQWNSSHPTWLLFA